MYMYNVSDWMTEVTQTMACGKVCDSSSHETVKHAAGCSLYTITLCAYVPIINQFQFCMSANIEEVCTL